VPHHRCSFVSVGDPIPTDPVSRTDAEARVSTPLLDEAVTTRVKRLPRARSGLTFAGPAFLVAVGYMDPGNWGADLAAGSGFGYTLLWVLVAANIAALVLQYLSAKVGIATGKDLAAIIGERSDPGVRRVYAGVGIVAMLATETAEFLGVVTGLRLLLRIPLLPSIVIGAVLVLCLLALGRRGDTRNLERAIFVLLGVVGVAYVVELWLVPPDVGSTLTGLLPGNVTSSTLPVIVGMVGAVVMPHNLFLHSGLIQSRREPGGDRRALVRRSSIESVVALNLALLVNAAIMLMAAAAFHGRGVEVTGLAQAHETLVPILGRAAAGVFALALLAAGLSSSVTGGIATQYVIRGLVRPGRPLSPFVSRLCGFVPAVVVLVVGVGEIQALLWSQIVLALVLPAVAIPLVVLSRNPGVMGALADGRGLRRAATLVVTLLSALSLAGLGSAVGLF
jgi:manganese transport protein